MKLTKMEKLYLNSKIAKPLSHDVILIRHVADKGKGSQNRLIFSSVFYKIYCLWCYTYSCEASKHFSAWPMDVQTQKYNQKHAVLTPKLGGDMTKVEGY